MNLFGLTSSLLEKSLGSKEKLKCWEPCGYSELYNAGQNKKSPTPERGPMRLNSQMKFPIS